MASAKARFSSDSGMSGIYEVKDEVILVDGGIDAHGLGEGEVLVRQRNERIASRPGNAHGFVLI
ncbi:hypothetical protein [Mycobacterium cookii]|uniref:hypothetical protein n=1 Tax=Mycobacterium cookii TaxID=1775 RepID=UPI0021F2AB9C|nr:hypothetical protein [Mycobacterium cookii]MCV7329644.1 hypothetical protein [Mycobacterium cookii]